MNEKTSIGPIIGSLIIVIILIIGAVYVWGKKLNTNQNISDQNAATEMSQETDDQTTPAQVTPVTSTSTDMSSIQTDLDAQSQY